MPSIPSETARAEGEHRVDIVEGTPQGLGKTVPMAHGRLGAPGFPGLYGPFCHADEQSEVALGEGFPGAGFFHS